MKNQDEEPKTLGTSILGFVGANDIVIDHYRNTNEE